MKYVCLALLSLSLASCRTSPGRAVTSASAALSEASLRPRDAIASSNAPAPVKTALEAVAWPVAVTGTVAGFLLFLPGMALSPSNY